jgi:transposase
MPPAARTPYPTDISDDERTQVDAPAAQIQVITGDHVELAWVDAGYIGTEVAQTVAAHGIQLEVVKLPEAKCGFVLLPRRWFDERSFAWMARFRRLAGDYERHPSMLSGRISSRLPDACSSASLR